jgi:hypothetical protein
MTRPLYVPQDKSEVLDQLAMMFLYAPTFEDDTGYFPDRNIASVFAELDAGLDLIRPSLGEVSYEKLTKMSAEIRGLFESDPRDENGGTSVGRKLILEMEELLGMKR